MSTKRNNEWRRRFGAKRHAIDQAVLAACERQIEAEERAQQIEAAIAQALGQLQ